MEERYGDKVQFRPVEQRQSWFKQKLGLGARTAFWSQPQINISSIVDDAFVAIEDRSLWNKFGL
jgi:hypothetical protein